MNADSWISLRVWFTKTGRARYISHLDLNRCMSRAIHKAQIPLWYTEGFNPHPFMTFALPLSLGIDGVKESMDIRLMEEVDKETLINGINSGLPEDIRIYDVTAPVMKPGKIAFAAFDITVEPEDHPVDETMETIQSLLDQETITVKKRSKSGVKDVDIKPFLDIRALRTDGDMVKFTAMLPAGSTQNVNPQLLFDALEQFCGVRFYARMVRTNLYDGDGVEFA